MHRLRKIALIGIFTFVLPPGIRAQNLSSVPVEGQPLASNVSRVPQALDSLGMPLPVDLVRRLVDALKTQDATKIQELLDAQVLIVVNINPEARVRAKRGPPTAVLQQAGYTPILLKIINESAITKSLHIRSPQALPIFTRPSALTTPTQRKEYSLKKCSSMSRVKD